MILATPETALADSAEAASEHAQSEQAPGPQDHGHSGAGHFKNYLIFKFAYSRHLLAARHSAEEGGIHADDMFGFILGYSRALTPWLLLGVAKPFLWNAERFDSPLDVLLKGVLRLGRFEMLLGLGATMNLRIFSAERQQEEGHETTVSFGLLTEASVAYSLTRHWALELSMEYAYIPESKDVVEHEVTPSFGAVYGF